VNSLFLRNGRIYQGRSFVPADLLVVDGRIEAVGPQLACPADAEVLELNGACVAPGFIDLHTHGGNGIDVNAADAAQLNEIGAFFARHGVTGWQCSVLTDTEEQTLWCIGQAQQAMQQPGDHARLLGVHLEGPFLAPAYKGAMPEHLLQPGNAQLVRRYLTAAPGVVKYITVSPEVEGVPEMIAEIADQVKVAIGHSGADYDTACRAIENGAAAATHTFNAMRLLHQHEPAIMGAVLESDIYCEAICDGRHLHPGTVRFLLKCKGLDRVVAITDSIQAAGLPDGHYKLGVNDVVVVDGDAKLVSNGSRAGSTLTMDTALVNLMKFTGRPAEELLPLMTENPARLLELYDRKGSIAPGKDADLVVLGADWQVLHTIVDGKIVYSL